MLKEYPYLYETHMHTCHGSACAKNTGAEMADSAKRAGYTGIIITDHNWGGNTCVDRSLPWEEWVDLYSEGYRQAKKRGDEIGLDVWFGMEAGFNGTEFLIYGITPEWMKEHPELRDADPVAMSRIVHEGGGIYIQAHPFREEYYIPEIRLFPEIVDGVEMINASNKRPEFNSRAIEYANKNNLPGTAGSDIHSTELLGAGVAFKYRLNSIQDFCNEIKKGGDHVMTDGKDWYDKQGNKIDQNKKLGFGLMRLPHKGTAIDVKQTAEMVDIFLDAGFTYFDTAFIYPGSENAIRKALVERYPRESYTLATKLFAAGVPTENLAKKEFETSLKRTGAGYFDYYLLHSLMDLNYKLYDKYHLWDFVKEEKEKGRIKHYGFSFHAGPELLDKLLTDHPDVDFVQLQINYRDWEDPGVQSRANYEVARKHGKQIVVMEPVKGGKLADPPQEVKDIFDKVDPGASYASWAIRFVASLDGILAVLSGMSNVEQVKDNTGYMKDFKPLNDEEREAIKKAQEILGSQFEIPCTACSYCTKGCPKQIPIPDIFKLMNDANKKGKKRKATSDYADLASKGSSAADCIKCRRCESVCPQHIKISDMLDKCKETF